MTLHLPMSTYHEYSHLFTVTQLFYCVILVNVQLISGQIVSLNY